MCVFCGFLQVVVVFCLWSTDVSRAYVFQATRPTEGGDNPPPHIKGQNSPDVGKICFFTFETIPHVVK